MIELLEPWCAIDDRSGVEQELARELPAGHVLAGKTVRAVARRDDRDDVLFEVAGMEYAVVHLTWRRQRETDPRWPSTELYATLEDWREQTMLPDHEDYTG